VQPPATLRATAYHPTLGSWHITLRQATLAEMGVGFLPSSPVRRDIDDGRLELLLPDHALPPLALHVVYPSRQHLPAKVRTFVDFLAEYFQATPRSSQAGENTRRPTNEASLHGRSHIEVA
jgi:DNA-binding transcriptional LysR family regulator